MRLRDINCGVREVHELLDEDAGMLRDVNNIHTIKAIVHDVDGTMVDSEPLHVLAWDKTLQEHGHAIYIM